MDSNGIKYVNDIQASVNQDGSLTAVIGSNTVYKGMLATSARKKEVNVKIIASDSNNLLLRSMPLFDEKDLIAMKNQSGSFKYVHIGCITVSIEPLVHLQFLNEYGKNIKGACIIFDTTFENFEESIISAHTFNLAGGRADFVCYPNHCLSASDINLSERISVLLCMDNIKVKKGNEMLTLCIGHITTGTNTLNPSTMLENKGLQNLSLTGTSSMKISEIDEDIKTTLEEASRNGALTIEPSGQDEVIRPYRGVLKRIFQKPPKVVVRRNYVAGGNPDGPALDNWYTKRQTEASRVPSSRMPNSINKSLLSPRKSTSAPSSPTKSYPSSSRSDNQLTMSKKKYYLDEAVIMSAIDKKRREYSKLM
ncbi:movement protein [Actinidia cytorhabdovirus JS27]|uniref:Movement protein n=1 Tax=Actinidia virus D TaxID=3069721 RepID=A0A8E6YJT8_9RHAB|nr:movement protein [Actinidia cytorhabdovirus JS27]QVU21445.1 movement protein [Actinidia virus D]